MSITNEPGRRYTLSRSIRALKNRATGDGGARAADEILTEIPGGSTIEVNGGAQQHGFGMLNVLWQSERYIIHKNDSFVLGVRVA